MGLPSDNADLLCAFLANTDAPCPNCGYNLRGLTEGSCPECGDPLALELARQAPKHGLVGVGMVPLGLGALYGILFTAAEIYLGNEEPGSVSLPRAAATASGAVLFSAAALAWWGSKERLVRLPLVRLRWLCALAWVGSVLLGAACVWLITHV